MFLPQLTATLALAPALSLGTPAFDAAPSPVLEASSTNSIVRIAQNQDPYANWIYLYEDSFQNSSGEQITQQWWLNPEDVRRNNIVEFTLLARRSPVSGNGTAAAVFDYIADCDTMSQAIKKTTFLDSNNAVLDSQTSQQPMEPANPETPFYGVLQDLCSGS